MPWYNKDTADGCEILHRWECKSVVYPIGFKQPCWVVQDFAGPSTDEIIIHNGANGATELTHDRVECAYNILDTLLEPMIFDVVTKQKIGCLRIPFTMCL